MFGRVHLAPPKLGLLVYMTPIIFQARRLQVMYQETPQHTRDGVVSAQFIELKKYLKASTFRYLCLKTPSSTTPSTVFAAEVVSVTAYEFSAPRLKTV